VLSRLFNTQDNEVMFALCMRVLGTASNGVKQKQEVCGCRSMQSAHGTHTCLGSVARASACCETRPLTLRGL
jgi:hypothetical protein